MGKHQKKYYNIIDKIIDNAMNGESKDTESDIDLGESDYEKESSDSEILDYESEVIDITNEPDILTNTGTVEFQDLLSLLLMMPNMSLYITLSHLHPHLCQVVILCHNH